MTAAAAGLDVVDLAQLAGFDDLLDHLHILGQARLEADGDDLAALLLGAADFDRLLKRHAHRLFKQDVQAVLKGVHGADAVVAVVDADAHRVHGDGVHHFPEVDERGRVHLMLLEELSRLAGDQVAGRDDLHVRLIEVRLDVGVGDAAGADDADAQLCFAVHGGLFGHVGGEVVHVKRHKMNPPCFFYGY